MNRARRQIIIAVFALCATCSAGAAGIHKWVDADGLTHYSDEAPAATEIPVTVIDVPPAARASARPPSGYYSIANQWERMHRERIERDRLALEKARLNLQQQTVTPTGAMVGEAAATRYVTVLPGYFYRGKRQHRRFGHRSRGGAIRQSSREKADLGYFPHVH